MAKTTKRLVLKGTRTEIKAARSIRFSATEKKQIQKKANKWIPGKHNFSKFVLLASLKWKPSRSDLTTLKRR